MKPILDVVIPSWNGRGLLEKHLPAILKYTPDLNRIIVVDDASSDGTGEYLSKLDRVKCLHHDVHLGFTRSVNLGFRDSTAELVLLLNNDVEVLPKFLDKVVPRFKDEKLFAVTLNEINSSWPEVSFSEGKLQYVRGKERSNIVYSAWASGGSSVISRGIWNRLGGFNEIYSPGYWEDIDIGWRAWKMGYRIIWDPSAKVEHQHESSFSRLDPKYVSLIKERNELLFNWQNITDPVFKKAHITNLIRRLTAHPGYFKVLMAATIGFLRSHGKFKQEQFKLSDREVLEILKKHPD